MLPYIGFCHSVKINEEKKKSTVFNSLILFIFVNVTLLDTLYFQKVSSLVQREQFLFLQNIFSLQYFVAFFIHALKLSAVTDLKKKKQVCLRSNFSILYRTILYLPAFPCHKTLCYSRMLLYPNHPIQVF